MAVDNKKLITVEALQSVLTTQKEWLQTEFGKKQNTLKVSGTGLSLTGDTLSIDLDTAPFVVVSKLESKPASGQENKIYLVPGTSKGSENNYTEYLWIDNAWEKIGEFTPGIDWDSQLEGYAKETDALKSVEFNGTSGNLSYTPIDGSSTTVTIGAATSSNFGFVKSSTTGTTSGKDYNVEVNIDGTMKVNVPWTDTVFTPKNGNVTTVSDSAVNVTAGTYLTTTGGTLDVDTTKIATVDSVNTKYGKTEVDNAINDALKNAAYTTNTGTVTKVTGAAVADSHLTLTGEVTDEGTLTVGVASGYAIPSSEQIANWESAYEIVEGLDGTLEDTLEDYLKVEDFKGYVTDISVNGDQISYTVKGTTGSINVTNKVNNVANATNATNATNLVDAPALAAGTTDAKKITVKAGNKTSEEFEVPYAKEAGSATTATTATNIAEKPVLANVTSNNTVTVTVGDKTSDGIVVAYATKAGTASALEGFDPDDYVTKTTYPGDTTYGVVRAGANITIVDGVISAATPDEFELEAATGDKLGGIKLGYTGAGLAVELDAGSKAFVDVTTATAAKAGLVKSSTTGTEAGKDYNVQVNTDGTMKVNVPWTNTTVLKPGNCTVLKQDTTDTLDVNIGNDNEYGLKIESGILKVNIISADELKVLTDMFSTTAAE